MGVIDTGMRGLPRGAAVTDGDDQCATSACERATKAFTRLRFKSCHCASAHERYLPLEDQLVPQAHRVFPEERYIAHHSRNASGGRFPPARHERDDGDGPGELGDQAKHTRRLFQKQARMKEPKIRSNLSCYQLAPLMPNRGNSKKEWPLLKSQAASFGATGKSTGTPVTPCK